MKKHLLVIFLCVSFFWYCTDSDSKHSIENKSFLPEIAPQEIKLKGIGAERFVEASGLAWFNDWLVILPQYPYKIYNKKSGGLLAIHKYKLLNYVNGIDTSAIECQIIPFSAVGFDSLLHKYGSGLEAAAFYEDEIFLCAESFDSLETKSYLLKGKVYGDLDSVSLDSKYQTEIKSASGIDNFSDETIVMKNNLIYTIHESNGKNIVDSPKANLLDDELHYHGYAEFPNVEYRITDATSVDSSDKFYVLNYFYSGENFIKPNNDPLEIKWGIGETNAISENVERILQFQITDDKIILTEKPPNYLKLESSYGRNWEGIVKLDSLGFIIVTDYHPRTILAFVPFSNW